MDRMTIQTGKLYNRILIRSRKMYEVALNGIRRSLSIGSDFRFVVSFFFFFFFFFKGFGCLSFALFVVLVILFWFILGISFLYYYYFFYRILYLVFIYFFSALAQHKLLICFAPTFCRFIFLMLCLIIFLFRSSPTVSSSNFF